MPKIFLIKNRLHQQQLKLLESQKRDTSNDNESHNAGEALTPPGSPLSDCQPLSLIVNKSTGRNTFFFTLGVNPVESKHRPYTRTFDEIAFLSVAFA